MKKATLSPPELAKLWGCKPEAVLAHIKTGRLRAFPVGDPAASRPRWRIPLDAIREFEQRSWVRKTEPAPTRRRRQEPTGREWF